MTAVPSVEAGLELAKLAMAFRPSTQFFIAARIGLFDQIAEDGSTAAEIAGSVSLLPESAVMSVLSAQVESGVLSCLADGRFRVREDLRPLLCCGAESVVADLMTFARENDVWLAASSLLRERSEAPLEYRRELLDSKIARYRGIQSLNRIVAFDILSELREHTQGGAVEVLDIGGGDGLYSELLLDEYPEARVCILDLDGGFALDKRHTQHLASGRLTLQIGDARTFAASRAYDLVIVNELLELFPYAEKVEILKHALRAVAPNGHLVVTKFALSADQLSPASSAVFSLRMHFKTSSGYLESDDEVVTILNSIGGADDIQSRPIQQGIKTMIIARRPNGSEHARSDSKSEHENGNGNGNGSGREKTHLRDQEPASPAQLELWRQLVSGATAFRPAALLFASAELDLYANIAVDGGSTSSEVAERLGMRELSVRLLMNALAAIGLLALEDGRFHVHPELRLLLTEGPHSVVQEVLQYKRENQLWLRLAEILAGGQAERGEGLDQMEAAHLSQYLSAVQLSNRGSAEKLVARLAESYLHSNAPTNVLDVGGGLGSYTRLLLGVGGNASVKVTLLDRQQVIEECRRTFTRELESGQLELVAGDALDFKLGARFDLVLMNDLLHYFSNDEKTRILSNAKNALTPSGRLVVSKFTLGETAISPAGAALFSMKVHLKKVDAYLDTDHETMEIIRGLGFAEVRTEALDESRSLILGFMSVPT